MTAITEDSTVRIRIPVATDAEIDAARTRGTVAFSSEQRTATVCPDDGQVPVRLGIHPADVPAASTLGGSDIVLIVQGGVMKSATVAALSGGGVWQPLDADLTAIAALATLPFGRSLLTLADAVAVRTAIGAPSISDLGGYQPLDTDLTEIAALTTAAFGRSLLTLADAVAVRTAIGAGTSSFSGAYSALSGIPAAIDALDALTPAADRVPYFTNGTTAALAPLSAFARTILDDADGPAVCTTIGAIPVSNPNFTGSLSQGGVTRIASNGDAILHAGTVRGNGSDTVGAGPYWQIDNYPTSPAMAWLHQLGADNGEVVFHSNNGVWSEKWRYMQDGALKQAGSTRITSAGGFRGTDAVISGPIASIGAGSDTPGSGANVQLVDALSAPTDGWMMQPSVDHSLGFWARYAGTWHLPIYFGYGGAIQANSLSLGSTGSDGALTFRRASNGGSVATIIAQPVSGKLAIQAESGIILPQFAGSGASRNIGIRADGTVAVTTGTATVGTNSNIGDVEVGTIQCSGAVVLTLSGGADGEGWDVWGLAAYVLRVPAGVTLYGQSGLWAGPVDVSPGGGRAIRVKRLNATTWLLPNYS